MQQMSHYVTHVIYRYEDARMNRELEARRVRAALARAQRRDDFYAQARSWRDWMFVSRRATAAV